MKKNTNIIFIRHGVTDLNAQNIYFGHLDPPLNKHGIEQINNIKKILLNEKVDLFYSSDLKRCVESAEIINEVYKLNIVKDKKFRELNFGIFEGKSYKEITEEFPLESKMFFKNWKEYKIPNGESLEEHLTRSINKIEEIKNENMGKNIIITAHSGTIRSIITHYLYNSLDGYWKFKFDNGSATKLCFTEDNFVYLEYLNRI
ncbi:MAG: alpha-ribazole phosphatase [Sebaldella sp.]|nr:alpha-ribazole phosphatase [Sebaldella sp.]